MIFDAIPRVHEATEGVVHDVACVRACAHNRGEANEIRELGSVHSFDIAMRHSGHSGVV
jgi:hypothetical protein